PFHGLDVAVIGGMMEGRPSLRPNGIDIRPRLHQHFHGVHTPLVGRPVEGGLIAVVPRRDIRAVLEKFAEAGRADPMFFGTYLPWFLAMAARAACCHASRACPDTARGGRERDNIGEASALLLWRLTPWPM
ncbi:MAG: hypothetical protein R6X33_13725, partial [Candidatus Brocadiia bacterium]